MKIDSFIKTCIITFSALFMNFTQKAYVYTYTVYKYKIDTCMLPFFCILIKTNLVTAKDPPTHVQELTVQKNFKF